MDKVVEVAQVVAVVVVVVEEEELKEVVAAVEEEAVVVVVAVEAVAVEELQSLKYQMILEKVLKVE